MPHVPNRTSTTLIATSALRDRRLSLSAKGLLAALMAGVDVPRGMADGDDGPWYELQNCGYLKLYFDGTYLATDEPQ